MHDVSVPEWACVTVYLCVYFLKMCIVFVIVLFDIYLCVYVYLEQGLAGLH